MVIYLKQANKNKTKTRYLVPLYSFKNYFASIDSCLFFTEYAVLIIDYF